MKQDDRFSEIRSLVHRETWRREEREHMWQLIEASCREDKERFRSEVVPYLVDYERKFESCLVAFKSATTFMNAARVAPFARFRLEVKAVEELQEVLNSQYVHSLGGVHFSHHGEGSEGLKLLSRHDEKLCHLIELGVSFNRLDVDAIERLSRSAYVKRLTWLGLRKCELGTAHIKALSSGHTFDALETLHIGENQPGFEGFGVLFEEFCSPALREIELSASAFSSMGRRGGDTFLEDAGLELLAGCAAMQNVRSLSANFSRISAKGVQALVNSDHLPHLEQLMLDTNPNIGVSGANVIANSKGCARLMYLSLSQCQLGDDGAKALASSPYLRDLQLLDLSSNKIGDEGVEALSKSDVLSGVHTLNLGANRIAEEGATALFSSDKLASLTSLSFFGNGFGASTHEAYLRNTRLRGLKSLNLGGCKISDELASHMLMSSMFEGVKSLILSRNNLSHLSAAAFRDTISLNDVEVLQVRDSQFTPEDFEVFFEADLKALKELTLSGRRLGDVGVKALLRTPYIGRLKVLRLQGMDLTNDHLMWIAKGRWESLRELDLLMNYNLSDVEPLKQAQWFKSLERFSVERHETRYPW